MEQVVTIIRYYDDKEVGGIRGWNWIESDTGAWVGPKQDWENHHLPNIQNHVKNFRTVIQAGGNQGMYPRLLSRLFKTIYTFEPDPDNFKALVTNCDQHNIFKFQAALGEKTGWCHVNRLTMQNTGMHKVEIGSADSTPLLRLDSFMDFTDVDLIMLDLEGYELHALKGMYNIIFKNNPVIFVERPSELIYDYFRQLGYNPVANSAMDVVFKC